MCIRDSYYAGLKARTTRTGGYANCGIALNQRQRVYIHHYIVAWDFLRVRVCEHGTQRRVHTFPAGGLQQKVIAVLGLQSHDDRGCGSHDTYACQPGRFEPLAQDARPGQRLVEFAAAHQHVADGVERRVVHPATEANFFFVESMVVVRGGELDGVVVGKKCLQHDFAGSVASPGASRNLGEQLEGALGGTEVRKTERGIGADDPHQRDVGDVVALGDHLRAHQQIDFARVQRVQHALEIVAAMDRIAIEPGNARLRKHAVQDVLQLLRSGPQILHTFAAALGAGPERRARVAAVVAHQAVFALVVGHGDGAVLALHALATFPAEYEGG